MYSIDVVLVQGIAQFTAQSTVLLLICYYH